MNTEQLSQHLQGADFSALAVVLPSETRQQLVAALVEHGLLDVDVSAFTDEITQPSAVFAQNQGVDEPQLTVVSVSIYR